MLMSLPRSEALQPFDQCLRFGEWIQDAWRRGPSRRMRQGKGVLGEIPIMRTATALKGDRESLLQAGMTTTSRSADKNEL